MYKIIIQKSADKFIRKQDKTTQQRLLAAIRQLPDGNNIKKLKGFETKYRLRVGDYRIIYDKFDNELVISVINVDNRGQVYNKIQ